ncbi:MAG: hypothetical protein M0035_03945 [Actinomycetota bacterium]|nr:hypothetical protein [Actinomycetota bacterium]
MTIEGAPKIRLGAIQGDAVLVVRGGALDPGLATAAAVRFRRRYPAWDRYGISALLAADDDEIDVLCETRLERFSTVAVFRRADLEVEGVEIVPTFRRPYVTLAHTDLDALVNGLLSCKHRLLSNRHHRGQGDIRP